MYKHGIKGPLCYGVNEYLKTTDYSQIVVIAFCTIQYNNYIIFIVLNQPFWPDDQYDVNG